MVPVRQGRRPEEGPLSESPFDQPPPRPVPDWRYSCCFCDGSIPRAPTEPSFALSVTVLGRDADECGVLGVTVHASCLRRALTQEHTREVVDRMLADAGPAPPA